MNIAPMSRKSRTRSRVGLAAAAVPLLLLAACGDGGSEAFSGGDGGGEGEVVIAYQDYTEMSIMAEMYAALLEDGGYDPTLKGVGDRAVYAGQLASGDVHVAPEYVSSMTEYLNREINGADAEPVATPDVDETMTKLEDLAGQQGMTALEPAEAEDANAYAVTQEFSEQNDVTTLSDLGKLGRPITMAGAPDCPDRPDCLGGLEEVYGIEVGKFEPLGFGTAQTKDALTNGEVDLGAVGTSDGQVDQLGLVVLEDDKNWQNAENLVPVVSTEFLEANPKLEEILNELSGVLTTDDLKNLNRLVDAERQLASDVAQTYLEDEGLL